MYLKRGMIPRSNRPRIFEMPIGSGIINHVADWIPDTESRKQKRREEIDAISMRYGWYENLYFICDAVAGSCSKMDSNSGPMLLQSNISWL